MESEVMTECGSWRSFTELEEWLTLEELITLYEKVGERQFRLTRVIAAARGVELDDPYSGDEKEVIRSAHDVAQLPFGLGYVNNG